MNRLLNLASIPMRFFIVTLAGAALPIVILLLVGYSFANSVQAERTAALLGTASNDQRVTIENNLNRVLFLETSFTDTRRLINDIENVLNQPDEAILRGFLENSLRNALIDLSGGLVDGAWIVSADGEVLALTTALENDPAFASLLAENQSEGEAFRTGMAMVRGGQRSTELLQTTQADGSQNLIVISSLTADDGSLLGFVMTDIDVESAVLGALGGGAQGLEARSYLVSQGEQVLALPDTIAQGLVSTAGLGFEEAVAGRTGIEQYSIETADGEQQVLGYFAPLRLSDIASGYFFLNEIPASEAQIPFTAYWNVGALILVALSTTLVFAAGWLFNRSITPALVDLSAIAQQDLYQRDEPTIPHTERADEIGAMARSIETLVKDGRSTLASLESRVEARIHDLDATREIGMVAASATDLETMMHRVVQRIVESFAEVYHAQIFLLSPDRRWAELRASTGEPGQRLLARGHRLAVGSISVIGQVTSIGEPVIARDTATSDVHRQNEFLPDTRAELAVPLRSGLRVIGALDVQSRQRNSFNEEDTRVFQMLASQISIAVENLRATATQVAGAAPARDSGGSAIAAWHHYLLEQRTQWLTSTSGQPGSAAIDNLREQAMQAGETVIGTRTAADTIPIAIPVVLRGEAIGVVAWEVRAADFNREQVLLAQELVSRLAISLDNARLFQQSRRATERERLVNEIAARISQKTDIQDIMQTAITEIGQALKAPSVNISLSPAREDAQSPATPAATPTQASPVEAN
jgi:GAF domain-containing protein/HAMP domain-containing protein